MHKISIFFYILGFNNGCVRSKLEQLTIAASCIHVYRGRTGETTTKKSEETKKSDVTQVDTRQREPTTLSNMTGEVKKPNHYLFPKLDCSMCT